MVECGLGGSPLVEPGLDNVGPSVLVEEDNALSSDLVGICKEERLGLLETYQIQNWFIKMQKVTQKYLMEK